MSKFKSGDKVELQENFVSWSNQFRRKGTILTIDKYLHELDKVKFKDISGCYVADCRFKVIKEDWINGIPQAGTVCKLQGSPRGIWGVAEILYISKDVCVWRWQESQAEAFNRIECVSFRPLKTKEEIEREEAISEMNKDLHYFWDDDETIAGYLISKGWRKK